MRNEQFRTLAGCSATRRSKPFTIRPLPSSVSERSEECMESLSAAGSARCASWTLTRSGSPTSTGRFCDLRYDRERKDAGGERVIGAINPSCEVEVLPFFVNKESVHRTLKAKRRIWSSTRSIRSAPKVVLLEYAYKANIPAISSMGACLRRDPFRCARRISWIRGGVR